MKLFGIDISTHQKSHAIDYEKIAKQIKFVILRATWTGHGTGESLYVDAEFEKHYKAFHDLGVPIGVYHYSCADTVAEGKREAEFLLKAIEGKEITYPVFWDTEDSHHQRPISRKALTDIGLAFCERVKQAGYTPGVYASTYWFKGELELARLNHLVLWVADYRGYSKPPVEGVDIFQFSSRGRLSGYNGNLDFNYSYVDYAAGKAKPEVKPEPPKPVEPKPVTPAPKNEVYTVKSGDTLSTIAKAHKMSLKDLIALNKQIKDPNKIYSGDKVNITANATSKPPVKPPSKPPVQKTYTVKSGDTMSGIAKAHKMTLKSLVDMNKQIKDPNKIYPGQKINVK